MCVILITYLMRKVIYIAIIAAIAMFCLQGLWIGNMYRAYVTQTIGTIENVMSVSIGKEIAFRRHASPYEDPEHPKIVYKAADDMTPEERSRLKGDTLDLDMMTRQHIGSNLAEMIMQFSQDDFIKKGKFVLLSKLDSIFRKELGRTEGFTVNVREMYVSAGAGFVVVLTGAVMTMPGLPKEPAAVRIDVDSNGAIVGLF